MSNDTPTEPVRPTAPVEPEPVEAAPPAPGKQSFRDRFRRVGRDGSGRTFGLAALLASTLAALIVGGLGGAALHAAFDDDDRRGPWDRGGWMGERYGPGDRGDRGDWRGGSGPGMPGMPGQVPPALTPDEEGSNS